MKKATLLLLTTIVSTVSFTSCNKTCDEWHEGKKCETETREKYYGTYSGTGTATTGGQTTTNTNAGALIAENSQGAQFLSDLGNGIFFKLRNSTEFDIPTQTLTVNGTNYTTSGNGSFTTTKLTYSMVASGQGQPISIFYEGSK